MANPSDSYSYSLISAASRGDSDELEAFLSFGANVNETAGSYPRNTPLILASERGHSRCVDLLLSKGANPNMSNELERTPLMYALTDACVSSLIGFGANVNARDKARMVPIMFARCAESVRLLLKAGADPNARDRVGRTPLHYHNKDFRSVKVLLDYDVDPNARDEDEVTPLMCSEDPSVAELLLDAGAYPSATDKDGATVVEKMIRNLDPATWGTINKVLRAIVKRGGDPNKASARSDKPLIMTLCKSKECAETLIEAGADLHATDWDGMSVLMHAVHYIDPSGDRTDHIDFLVNSGASLNGIDHDGRTVLMHAIMCAHESAVNRLIKLGASVDARDSCGWTPLAWAVHNNGAKRAADRGCVVGRILRTLIEKSPSSTPVPNRMQGTLAEFAIAMAKDAMGL